MTAPEPPSVESVRALLQVNAADAEAVIASYLLLSRAVAAFPTSDIEEPALRSTPGPVAE